jgi:polyhydroxybutyrate depolymerase
MSRRRLLPAIVIAVVLAGCGARCASAAPDDQSATFEFGGLSRTYLVHVPTGRPTGLVVNLHGGGSTGAEEERLTNFDAVADADGFVVVYPDGSTTTGRTVGGHPSRIVAASTMSGF